MNKPVVTLETSLGIIKVELLPEVAPITVNNFINLVSKGFYDGLIFHRVIDGFMIQGGCPEGTGIGGSGKNIKGEFTKNGVQNNIVHTKGVISMARAQAMNSASSQFFLMHQNSPHLDGHYAAFGQTIEGLDVIDKIATVKVDSMDRPFDDVTIIKATVELNGYEVTEA
jgi:peptidyl-prolyl cis-trans isomerase B (cyclophilin B)